MSMRFLHWKIQNRIVVYIKHPQNSSKTLISWDCSSYEKHQKYVTRCSAGYIRWVDILNIYDKGKELKSNLRKPPKLSYLALNPGNNKQNVPLALKTTIAAARSYFPNWRDAASFVEIFNTWWTISSSKRRFSPNIIRNVVINGDKKLSF